MRHTVKGVDRIRPTGPQSMPQKIAATKIARDETPVWLPYNQGSMRFAIVSSSNKNKTNVRPALDQPGNTARAMPIGKTAATGVPIYGTNRSKHPNTPQSRG